MLPPIKGFIENTMLDWEGKLASVVFLPGCNFRCGYCHVRHLVEPIPSDEFIPVEAVQLSLRRQEGWIDGVVISGGEPTLHEGLPALINLFRSEGIGVKLDTNGSRPRVLASLLERRMVDYVAMDVKAPLDERYAKVACCQVDVAAVRESIRLLIEGSVPYEFRTTVCPDHLSEGDIEEMAQSLSGAEQLYLQSFRPLSCLDRSLEKVKPYPAERMREICRIAGRYIRRVVVRGDFASEVVAAAT